MASRAGSSTMLRVDERTFLRSPVEADADPIFALVDANRAYLRRWLQWVDDTSNAASVRAFLLGALERIAQGTALEFVIEHDGQLAGLSGFRILDPVNRIGEIGYWLREDFGGRGVMTACCQALVRHGFESLGLNRIALAAAVDNARSRRIAERLGFQLEGVTREGLWHYDHFVDVAVYSVLRRDWRA